MAEGISLLDLPQLNVAQVEDGQFTYLVTPEGDPYKVAIEDLVGGVNTEAGAKNVLLHTQNISSAAMLAGNTTPIPVTITRAAGQSINALLPIVGSLVFNSAAYATNTVIGLRYVGADIPIATCDLLGRTASGTVNFIPVTTVGAAQSQYLADTDMEIYVLSGNPITGDSVTAVSFYYTLRV